MVGFEDVPYVGGTTFTFFPDGYEPMIRHFLPQARMSYQVVSYEDIKAAYPDLEIPAVPQDPSRINDPDAYCRHPLCILSSMNPEALQKRLYEIKDSPEARKWERARIRSLQKRTGRQLGKLISDEREMKDGT